MKSRDAFCSRLLLKTIWQEHVKVPVNIFTPKRSSTMKPKWNSRVDEVLTKDPLELDLHIIVSQSTPLNPTDLDSKWYILVFFLYINFDFKIIPPYILNNLSIYWINHYIGKMFLQNKNYVILIGWETWWPEGIRKRANWQNSTIHFHESACLIKWWFR